MDYVDESDVEVFTMKLTLVMYWRENGFHSKWYGGQESSTRCNFRKHVQIEKAPANQENIFTYLTAGAANAHNTTKEIILFAVRFFICLCCEHLQRMFCKIDEVVFLMCRCFFSICSVEISRQLHNDLIFSSKKKSFVEHLHLCI